jgi:tetratricopeptide (TPR) repeat protein
MRPLLVLTALALMLFMSEAAAQGVSVPETKNPHLRKIARMYDALEYEAALDLAMKADRHPANRAQERLWLDLMKGVLYHSLHDEAKADAAFSRALEQFPHTHLPLLQPSQTLHERFNTLRGEVLRARSNDKATVAAAPPQTQATPPLDQDLAKQGKAPQQQPQAQPAPPPAQTATDQQAVKQHPPQKPANGETPPLVEDTISQDFLLRRLDAMEKQWRHPVSGKPSPKLEKLFDELRSSIQNEATPDARLSAALRMDNADELLKSGKFSEEPKPASERLAEVEFPDGLSQKDLLEFLSASEAEHRKFTNKDLPPKVTILFDQVRNIILKSQTSDQRECAKLWVQALALHLEDERQGASSTGSGTTSRQPRALSGVSQSILIQRVLRMTARIHEQTEGQDVHQDLKRYLEVAAQVLVNKQRTHERMQLAATLDQLQDRIRQRFDAQKQSSNAP